MISYFKYITAAAVCTQETTDYARHGALASMHAYTAAMVFNRRIRAIWIFSLATHACMQKLETEDLCAHATG